MEIGEEMNIIVAITGASGAVYSVRLIEELYKNHKIFLIASKEAKKILKYETGYEVEQLKKMATEYYEEDDMESKLASGSFSCDAMIVVPCSVKTMAAIANGFAFNLIARAAICCLKEGKKLIVVPRETPLDLITLRNMVRLREAGAVVLAAMPAFYYKPRSIDDMVNFIVGKILEQLGIEHDLYERWR